VFATGTGDRTATLTWTPQPQDLGLYHVQFSAANALTATVSTAISVNSVDRAPVIAAPAQVEAQEGTALVVGVAVSDPDSNAVSSFTADLSGLPQGHSATFSSTPDQRNGTLRWTPGYADSGTYVVRWLAHNVLADTAQTLVHVSNTDRAPVVTAPA